MRKACALHIAAGTAVFVVAMSIVGAQYVSVPAAVCLGISSALTILLPILCALQWTGGILGIEKQQRVALNVARVLETCVSSAGLIGFGYVCSWFMSMHYHNLHALLVILSLVLAPYALLFTIAVTLRRRGLLVVPRRELPGREGLDGD